MNKEKLHLSFQQINLDVSKEQMDLLEFILSSTLEDNKKFNLTAIKESEVFMEKMIFDSALPLKNIDIKDKDCLDVGTGAGFPGLVLSVLCDTHIDLLDATAKKIKRLNDIASNKNIKIKGITSRCEIFSRANTNRYHFVFARAVSDLNILVEIIAPLLKIGGMLVAYKGPNYISELKNANRMISKLGLKIENIQKENLPESNEERNIIYIKKIKETPKKYPREYSEIIASLK